MSRLARPRRVADPLAPRRSPFCAAHRTGRDPHRDAPRDKGRRHRVVRAQHARESVLARSHLKPQIGVGPWIG